MPEILILSQFREYNPPADIEGSVRQLLRYVPEQYKEGLQAIHLTNSTASRAFRRNKVWSRGRKVPMRECAGFYCGDHIELLVDNLLLNVPRWIVRVPFLRTIWIGSVLFHEIGHHIHRIQQPEHREMEDVADAWQKRLMRQYMRRRYWYLRPIWTLARLGARGGFLDRVAFPTGIVVSLITALWVVIRLVVRHRAPTFQTGLWLCIDIIFFIACIALWSRRRAAVRHGETLRHARQPRPVMKLP